MTKRVEPLAAYLKAVIETTDGAGAEVTVIIGQDYI